MGKPQLHGLERIFGENLWGVLLSREAENEVYEDYFPLDHA